MYDVGLHVYVTVQPYYMYAFEPNFQIKSDENLCWSW